MSLDIKKYFILYANCIPVLGAKRSCIYDLQKCKVDFISNYLIEVLKELKNHTIDQVLQMYDDDAQEIIIEDVQLLLEKQFGFLGDEEERTWFPDMDLSWDSPSFIENAIIDVDEKSQHDYESIFKELSDLGCQAIQFRFYTKMPLTKLYEILALLENSRITSIDLLIPHTEEINKESLSKLIGKCARIFKITIHTVPNEIELSEIVLPGVFIFFSHQIVDSSAHCGFISPHYFSVNIKEFTESLGHNTCLNRKLSIDTASNIKNCPAMSKSFGKAGETKLSEVLKEEAFTKLWYRHKDQIKTCMDCEFRYMCSDCRAFLTDDDDPYSKPEKCGYDPYTMTWA